MKAFWGAAFTVVFILLVAFLIIQPLLSKVK